MQTSESSFYNLPYSVLSRFLLSCQQSKKNHAVYTIHLHQEAIDVLLDRMERAKSHFDRRAFELLMNAPVTIGERHLRGFIQSIVDAPPVHSFYVRVWLPDLNQEVDMTFQTPFSFDLERMPRRSVHAKVK